MPNSRMANAGKTNLQRRPCGIIRITALWPLCRYRHKTHWTGAEHRIGREIGKRHGVQAYAFEELIAELGAAFMCATFGIANEPRQDHAAYVATWFEVLNNDSRAIFRAASRAQEAIEYLGNLAAEKLNQIEATPSMSLREPAA